MFKRKCVSHSRSRTARRKIVLAEEEVHVLNATDFLTLDSLPRARWSSLDVVFDAGREGTSVFLRTSLQQLVDVAEREGIEALNPYTSVPLAASVLEELSAKRDSVGAARPSAADALCDRQIPTWPSTRQLIVDICVRLAFHGHFVSPQLLWEQRTGRMRRIHQAVSLLFSQNFSAQERLALAPPQGVLPPSVGWTSWAAWGQRAMLALAACAGERSRVADARLKKRGASVAIAALSMVIPDVRHEFGSALSIR